MEGLNVLFLTYYYPPQKYPRSVQISHLVQYLKQYYSLTVITLDHDDNHDSSLLSFTPLDNVLYAQKSCLSKVVTQSKGHRIKKAVLPDFEYLWHFDLLKKAQNFIKESTVDIIVTFGQPMSTHITGLKLKQKYPYLKWIAHFSDPWVDNIFNSYNKWTRYVNKYYQNRVFSYADQLLFTSSETIDLVTREYSEHVISKSTNLPHVFNPKLCRNSNIKRNKKITIRYIGNFYGNRQPECLFKALQNLPATYRAVIKIELIGSATHSLQLLINHYCLEDIVFAYSSVPYTDSLNLMQSSDMLLVIDAPTDISVFLPSKLIDYIGANKPIFGITPFGTSQKLIEEMGFLVAHPNNTTEIANKLMTMIQGIRNGKVGKILPNIRSRYSVSTIGRQIKNLLDQIVLN